MKININNTPYIPQLEYNDKTVDMNGREVKSYSTTASVFGIANDRRLTVPEISVTISKYKSDDPASKAKRRAMVLTKLLKALKLTREERAKIWEQIWNSGMKVPV